MELNWTTIISSGITAVVIGVFQFLALRYTGKILDNVEKQMRQIKKNGKTDDKAK